MNTFQTCLLHHLRCVGSRFLGSSRPLPPRSRPDFAALFPALNFNISVLNLEIPLPRQPSPQFLRNSYASMSTTYAETDDADEKPIGA